MRGKSYLFSALPLLMVAYSSHAGIAAPQCVRDFLRKSFIASALREGSGLVKSPFKKFIYEVSEGRFYPEVGEFFGPRAIAPVSTIEAQVLPSALKEIDSFLTGNGFPTMKLQNKNQFATWEESAKTLAKAADVPTDNLSDYMIFHKEGQTAFIRKGDTLIPVEVKKGKSPITLLTDRKIKIPASGEDGVDPEEQFIREYRNHYYRDENARLRKMSPVTNDMRYPRDREFEWEGKLIASLRSNGARSVPNIQEIVRVAGRKGLAVDAQGAVSFLPELEAPLERAHRLAFPHSVNYKTDFQRFGERQAYHTLALRYIEQNPELTEKFLKSEAFKKFAPEFVDKHLAYIGGTEEDVSRGMLAEMKLYAFEKRFHGVRSPAEASSQHFLADVPGYHTDIQQWLNQQPLKIPDDIPSLVQKLGGVEPFSSTLSLTPELKKVVQNANAALDLVEAQVGRHPTHNRLTEVAGRAGLITDTRRSFPNNIIANVGMAKSDVEGAYTVSAYFNPERADGYFGGGVSNYRELPRFTQSVAQVGRTEANQMLLDIVRSKTFADQTRKLEEHAPRLAKFLTSDRSVPESIREFAKTLYSDQFAETVYKKMGAVYDPNSFNRFFPDGYKDFQKMNMYRYLFDLAHGETTALVKNQVGKTAYLQRMFMGKWRPYAFDKVSEEKAGQALDEVLSAGQQRLKRLRHEPTTSALTPVDMRDRFEVWIGWDTYDMKFLRWANHWDEWDAMGGGWNCVCFTRKSIFNPFSIRQF